MKFSLSENSPVELQVDWLVAFVGEESGFSDSLQKLDEALDGSLSRLQERGDLTGKPGEIVTLGDVPQIAADRLLIVGVGNIEKVGPAEFHRAVATAARKIASKEGISLGVCFPAEVGGKLGTAQTLERIADAVVVSCSGQGLYKAEKDRYPLDRVDICGLEPTKENQQGLRKGQILAEAVNLTRELVNRHPDDIYPETFAQRAADEATALGIQGEILDQEMLEDEKMGALLAVSRGSDRPPRLVMLKYQGAGEGGPTLGLVGKGVTFDSGGLSIKPSAGMITMKCDMAGAATVLGAIVAIAKLKLPVNVVAVMGLVENMTGGAAYKLGSVLTARNGTTIEVHNTDAEGRLVLADALSYTVDQKVDKLIDLATLTGACVVALGEDVVGAFTNSQEWCDTVIASTRAAGEEIWQLPMYDFFAEQLKSEFADCKNVGSRWGGATTAAKFLEKFVSETPWVHLDIAGPSYTEAGSGHRDTGATGVMVRSLVAIAAEMGEA